jgi:predicted NBD/HSP70 family sugar kinase
MTTEEIELADEDAEDADEIDDDDADGLADEDGPVLVGVDFTGERLRLLLTDQSGRLVHEGEWGLPPLADEDAWAWEVGGRIATEFAAEGQRRSALAIVVAAPGSVDPVTGKLLHSTGQEGWDGLAIVDALRRHIGAPIAAESRTVCALLAEVWHGAAVGEDNVLYVSLRGEPSAAVLAGGRPARGAHFEAGALPAVPALATSAPLLSKDAEAIAGLLADAAALLDPSMVVLDGEPAHLERLVPLLQRVLDEVAPGPEVVRAEFGDRGAVIGAVRMATSLAFEGNRKP